MPIPNDGYLIQQQQQIPEPDPKNPDPKLRRMPGISIAYVVNQDMERYYHRYLKNVGLAIDNLFHHAYYKLKRKDLRQRYFTVLNQIKEQINTAEAELRDESEFWNMHIRKHAYNIAKPRYSCHYEICLYHKRQIQVLRLLGRADKILFLARRCARAADASPREPFYLKANTVHKILTALFDDILAADKQIRHLLDQDKKTKKKQRHKNETAIHAPEKQSERSLTNSSPPLAARLWTRLRQIFTRR